MLHQARGVNAQSKISLTLAMAGLLWGAGCSNPTLQVSPHRFVRIEALVPLHPSYEQVRSLDREVARLKTAPSISGQFSYSDHPGIALLKPRSTPSANLATQRAAQIDLDERRYLDSLRKSLTNSNQSVLTAYRRREQRRVELAVNVHMAEAAKALQDVNDVKLFAIRERIRTLSLRDIVVKSQIQDLAQARTADITPLRSAQNEHTAILHDVGILKTEDAAIRAQDINLEVRRTRDSFYKEELTRSKEIVAKREEELRAETRDRVAAAQREQRLSVIPVPEQPSLPPIDPRSAPLQTPVGTKLEFSAGAIQVQPVVVRQSRIWEAQRAALMAEIRADTIRAVQQVALQRGWRLELSQQNGAIDGTSEAADDLRTQWRMGKPE